MKKTLRNAAMAFCAAGSVLLTSCGTDQPATETTEPTGMTLQDSAAMSTDSARMGKPQGVEVGGARMTPDKDIVANAANSKDHTTLVAAVQAAGLAETLKGAGPYTVFAPSNAAFNNLPNGAVAGLMRPESKEKLQGVLKYHVIPSRIMAADLRDGQQLTTVNGEKVKVSVKDGKVMINNATVTIPDVVSSNGITHVIDQVLLPPAE
ncbi:fasciclin domain-containing protein [Hymenobacter lutimineralis]|uniref:Fasciclin domain-containing protein n=1 Tax=Hymenobacter lutimineralis TaxID=2606448 RepID=A0A5D6UZB6_9BACT|nr:MULTISPECIES: fasciclin domain-containing protein [Hymenobacter]QIX63188.1 fasciclin domain-containing protein [Hymenobacter sp. BT18]TYZ07839.1 fasciclin domain-containing protein [Hymenobacter lutimineralis]